MSTKQSITKLVVPLAGFGTRFLPSSSAYPKELVHLVDKPVLQYLVEEAYDSGIREIIFILNSQKGVIKEYFSPTYQREYIRKAFPNGAKIPADFLKFLELIKKIKFHYITKNSTLGDGHSVLLARSLIKPNEPFAVTMGDLLCFGKEPFIKQLISVYNKKNSSVISVEKGTDLSIPMNGVIEIRKSYSRLHLLKSIIEKPELHLAPSRIIMTGKYILTPDIFPYLEAEVKNRNGGEVKLANALKNYCKEHKLYAYECEGSIQDTGNKLDFLKATITFGLNHPTLGSSLKKFIKSLKI